MKIYFHIYMWYIYIYVYIHIYIKRERERERWGILKLSALNIILDWIILCCEGLYCHDSQNHLQTLPNVPWRRKLSLVEKNVEWIIWIHLMGCTYTGTIYYKVQPHKNPLELKYFQLWVIFIIRNIKYTIIKVFKNGMDPWNLLQFDFLNQVYLTY